MQAVEAGWGWGCKEDKDEQIGGGLVREENTKDASLAGLPSSPAEFTRTPEEFRELQGDLGATSGLLCTHPWDHRAMCWLSPCWPLLGQHP